MQFTYLPQYLILTFFQFSMQRSFFSCSHISKISYTHILFFAENLIFCYFLSKFIIYCIIITFLDPCLVEESNEFGSVCLCGCSSIALFSQNPLISFLQICIKFENRRSSRGEEPPYWGKFKFVLTWAKGVQTGSKIEFFREFLGNFAITFCREQFKMKYFTILCIPVQTPYL